MKRKVITVISLIAVFLFMFVAARFNNANGTVTITDVYYPNSEGGIIHAQLFVPDGVSSTNPAPAILNMHGGSDYLQTVGNYAIELARRGYVVLSVDAYGSGSSDFVSGNVATGAGGSGSEGRSSALKMDGGVSLGIEQLMTYKFVDQENIGMIGHSMGGTYVANAALEYADHIKAIMPWGSGSFVDMMKSHDTEEFTFNVGYINASSDEMVYFATHDKTSALFDNDELKNFVRTSSSIVPGQVYGSFEDGTARVIYAPGTTHIGNIICKDSIGSLVSFFEQAMPTGRNIPSTNQVWMYKELFCVLATIALIIFLVNFGGIILDTKLFSELVMKNQATVSNKTWMNLVGIIACIIIPALTLHKAGLKIATFKTKAIMPMNWANNLVYLAVFNAIIILVLFIIWHFVYGKKNGGSLKAYGFNDNSIKNIGLSLFFTVTLIFSMYTIVNICYALFKIDFRFWQFGIMPITPKRIAFVLPYFILYLLAFGVMNVVSIVFASLNEVETTASVIKQYVISLLIGAGGYIIILLIYYIGLKTTQKPPFFFAFPPFDAGHPNSLVFSMKTTVLVPTFALISIINTALYRKTKNIYVGWFVAALIAAMILIGSNAFAI